MYVHTPILLLSLLLLATSCSQKNKNTVISGEGSLVEAMAFAREQIGGKKVNVACNDDCTYFLATQEAAGEVIYVVTDIHSKVLLPKKKILGSVTWLSHSDLKVVTYPRVIKDKNESVGPTEEIISVLSYPNKK